MVYRIFLHGLESSNQGPKATYFRRRFPDMVTPHFTGPLEARMESLYRLTEDQSGMIIVGSSFGGLMGAIYAMESEERVRRLILLAPAINLPEFQPFRDRILGLPVWVFHGFRDEVIPLEAVRPVAEACFTDLDFREVDDDHVLHNTFETIEWERLLSP